MHYSKQEKEYILGQFHASRMPVKRACRLLPGFPYEKALRRWLKAEERGELTAQEVPVRGHCEDHQRYGRYPTETKREAVKLLGTGMEPADVARRLNVSSPETVKRWARLYNEGRLCRGKGDVGEGDFDDELKARAMRRYLAGEPAADVCADLGIGGPSSLYEWLRRAGGTGRHHNKSACRKAGGRKAEGHAGPPGGPRMAPDGEVAGTGGGRVAPEQGERFDWKAWGELPEDPSERAAEAEIKLAEALAVLDVLKAPGPGSLSNSEKRRAGTMAMASCPRLGTGRMLADLSIARSTFYDQAGRDDGADRYAALRGRLRHEFESNGCRLGSESLWHVIRLGEGEPVKARDLVEGDLTTPVIVSEKVVRRLMAEEGLVPVQVKARGRARFSSYGGEVDERPANVPLLEDGVHHEFRAEKPGKLAVSDVTEFKLDCGKAYLSPFLDCFDGDVISWELSHHPDSELCDASFEEAVPHLDDDAVVHTDGGATYRTVSWKGICEEHGITRSMSRKGTSPDNARMEGFFGVLKQEFYYCRDWTGVSFEEFRRLLAEYINWYRTKRLKKSLGWKTIEGHRREWAAAHA